MTKKYVYTPRHCSECGGELPKYQRYCVPCRRKTDPNFRTWAEEIEKRIEEYSRTRECRRCSTQFTVDYDHRYYFNCPECRKAAPKRIQRQTSVTHIVSIAVRLGILPKLDGTIPCMDCGKPATDYDHRGYNKPLDVDPTCHSCNLRRGPAIPLRSAQHAVTESEAA